MKKLIDFIKNWRTNSEYAKWLMKFTKPFLPRIILIMLMQLALTGISIYMALVSKEIIDSAKGGNVVILVVVVYAGMIVFNLVLSIATSLMSIMLNERFSFGIRKQVYEKIIRSYWMDVTKYHTGDLMTRLTSDAGQVSDGIIYVIPTVIQLIVELFATFFTLFYFSPLLALFALLVAPVAAIVAVLLGRKMNKLQKKVQESESRYRSFLQESLANILIVKSFANEDYSVKKLTKLRDERFHWIFERNKISLLSSSVMSLSFQLGYVVAFVIGAAQVSAKLITYGTMSVFLTLVNRIQSPIMGLAQQVPKIVSIFTSAGRIIELEDIEVEKRNEENIEFMQVGVNLENITYGYTDEPVLDGASLNIKPGEFVSIIGQSGIGKTTMVRLIMSFMNQKEGYINFYNSQGDKEEANAATREFIAYVPQGNTLFSGTVRENIQMGNLRCSEREMIKALKLSSAYDFVQKLPQGLDTVIGERGHGLSEGQAQRIAIARALVRRAPFLIFDEATSSLDEKTEINVLEGLKQLRPRPTCLLITHRKSVIPYCDRQICIENRKIVDISAPLNEEENK
ncbi:ABC-type multidrug transport system, ATPase and permease component [Acetitomaculum ruminis DSM 5522]|uniref:ABC-type multidrug transport system, ATPase and permease component n=1 Tax=Acetitomaculum ruminis DSM 5522 TaxID=1120918 RepID=A0A1I0Z5B6_9FIRM|nr:ABC transporter ATP-binding protein [Acetitomaculum ruminis]SFB19453.1 ABC-type multidrug transport system, ATPase and permease component [Acetitomaculum ruminis DSM 5522]